MKKTWEGIRNLIGRGKNKRKPIKAIKSDSSSPLVHDHFKMSNILNSHFASCGHRLAAKLPHSEKHFSDYLNGSSNTAETFVFHPVQAPEIISEILNLPQNKAYGLYSCPIRLLKSAAHILSNPLTSIINCSVKQGIYPRKLKRAKIVPIFKSGDETDPNNNYRPISLLSVVNKIFEKYI